MHVYSTRRSSRQEEFPSCRKARCVLACTLLHVDFDAVFQFPRKQALLVALKETSSDASAVVSFAFLRYPVVKNVVY